MQICIMITITALNATREHTMTVFNEMSFTQTVVAQAMIGRCLPSHLHGHALELIAGSNGMIGITDWS